MGKLIYSKEVVGCLALVSWYFPYKMLKAKVGGDTDKERLLQSLPG